MRRRRIDDRAAAIQDRVTARVHIVDQKEAREHSFVIDVHGLTCTYQLLEVGTKLVEGNQKTKLTIWG